MPKVAVVATLTAQPGKRDELVEAMSSLFDAVRDEQGTEVYALHTVENEPDKVVFYELYADTDALSAHSRSDAMKAAGPALTGLLAGRPELLMLTPARAKVLAV